MDRSFMKNLHFFPISLLILLVALSRPTSAAEIRTLDRCQALLSETEYHVADNLTVRSQGTSCFSGEGLQNVVFDCQNRTITIQVPTNDTTEYWSFLDVNQSSNIRWQNCSIVIQTSSFLERESLARVRSSSDITFENLRVTIPNIQSRTLPIGLRFTDSRNVHLQNNELEAVVEMDRSQGSLIERNIFRWFGEHDVPGLLIFSNGQQNIARANTFNGRYFGRMHAGVDDAIVLQDEERDTIEDNTASDFYDCGIETVNTVNDSIFRRNTIRNTMVCGIGGWYSSSLRGNVFEANILEVTKPFWFLRTYGRREGETDVFFADNQFIDNRVIPPQVPLPGPHATFSQFQFDAVQAVDRAGSPLSPNEIILRGNIFRGNDFGATGLVLFTPATVAVDQGGNRCHESPPLQCGTTVDGTQQIPTLPQTQPPPQPNAGTTFVDPSNFSVLTRTLGLTADSLGYQKALEQVSRDLREFRLTGTQDEVRAMANFITYGISRETIRLGAGERRATLRDYLQTVQNANVTWSDIQRLASGLVLVNRNLTAERSQVPVALAAYKKIFGHSPNFKNATENLAWNTLLYRTRFPRDLSKESKGLRAYQSIYHHKPLSPFDWATVRVLGYVK